MAEASLEEGTAQPLDALAYLLSGWRLEAWASLGSGAHVTRIITIHQAPYLIRPLLWMICLESLPPISLL